jgi:hypothetical protein
MTSARAKVGYLHSPHFFYHQSKTLLLSTVSIGSLLAAWDALPVKSADNRLFSLIGLLSVFRLFHDRTHNYGAIEQNKLEAFARRTGQPAAVPFYLFNSPQDAKSHHDKVAIYNATLIFILALSLEFTSKSLGPLAGLSVMMAACGYSLINEMTYHGAERRAPSLA